MGQQTKFRHGVLKLSVIGDEDTVTGFLLAGIGSRDGKNGVNYLTVTPKTSTSELEEFFKSLVRREDIGVILITQSVAERIRGLIDAHTMTIPTILEIPSKDTPYDSARDSVMQRVKVFFGGSLPGAGSEN